MSIYPSLMALSSSDMPRVVSELNQAKIGGYHVDFVDQSYAANLGMRLDELKDLSAMTEHDIHVHCMIKNPLKIIQKAATWGLHKVFWCIDASMLSSNGGRAHSLLSQLGDRRGLVLNPGQNPERVLPYLERIEIVIVMGVNPGFSGQAFIEAVLYKVKLLALWRKQFNFSYKIIMDGGVNVAVAKQSSCSGADGAVAGSFLFAGGCPTVRVDQLASCFEYAADASQLERLEK